MFPRPLVLTLISFLIFAGSIQGQRGALVTPRTLDQLTSQAERIVHGHVVSAKVEPLPQHPRLSTVVVTFRVQETLKGSMNNQITFRQLIWDFRDKQDAAGYRKGQELVLFLNKVTAEGLTSPSGLDQGRLRVEQDPSGVAVIHPKTPNSSFLDGLDRVLAKHSRTLSPSVKSAQSHPAQGIVLRDFKQTVRDLVSTRGTQK